MLRWCSYCQRFLGEAPDYDNLAVTHGVCAVCLPIALTFNATDLAHSLSVRDVQDKLFKAGQVGDLAAAGNIIEQARSANIRPVDILIGIVAPMLYQVGEDWKRGTISGADAHAFTAFCERLCGLVSTKFDATKPASAAQADQGDMMLMYLPGNPHRLAIRILAQWLAASGRSARIVEAPRDRAALMRLLAGKRTTHLLLSIALVEHVAGVLHIASLVADLPAIFRPKILVGGYAVKLGLVSEIPGCDLMADISAL